MLFIVIVVTQKCDLRHIPFLLELKWKFVSVDLDFTNG